jgi:hypothetical protein
MTKIIAPYKIARKEFFPHPSNAQLFADKYQADSKKCGGNKKAFPLSKANGGFYAEIYESFGQNQNRQPVRCELERDARRRAPPVLQAV